VSGAFCSLLVRKKSAVGKKQSTGVHAATNISAYTAPMLNTRATPRDTTMGHTLEVVRWRLVPLRWRTDLCCAFCVCVCVRAFFFRAHPWRERVCSRASKFCNSNTALHRCPTHRPPRTIRPTIRRSEGRFRTCWWSRGASNPKSIKLPSRKKFPK